MLEQAQRPGIWLWRMPHRPVGVHMARRGRIVVSWVGELGFDFLTSMRGRGVIYLVWGGDLGSPSRMEV